MGRPFMQRPDLYGHHLLGSGFWLLLIVIALVVGAILIARMFAHRVNHHVEHTANTPLRILEERFAKGEIDEQEFRARRDALRG